MPTSRKASETGNDERIEIRSELQDNPTAAPTSGQQDSESIARRAYERYQMRGGEDGRDQEDWFEAEREVLNEREGR